MAFPKTLPNAQVLDQTRVPRLRWGICGPGWIAERFVASLKGHTQQELLAVQSTDPNRAKSFAEKANIKRSYGGNDMMGDPDVDVVYIATVHPRHRPDALAAIEAGKHVLVEKPLALNASEARELAQAAHRKGVFLMEAYWTAFLPKFDVIRQLLDDGALGSVRTVIADHGEWFGPDHRIMRPELAGGPMLDLGTYPLAFATGVLGRPERIIASGEDAPSGVNGQASMLLSYPGGAEAVLHTTILSHTPGDAVVSGTQGMLTIPSRFYAPGPFTVTANDLTTKLVFDEPRDQYVQLFHQAVHLAECVAKNRLESPTRPLRDTLATLEAMDEVRRQLGVVFPQEERYPGVESPTSNNSRRVP
jgi:predicted dehydrogenase